MVRSSVRRAAALTGTAALAVLAGAGPALAAGGGNAPNAAAPAVVAGVQAGVGVQAGTSGSASDGHWCPPHHRGLVSGLLDGVVRIVDGLL